MFARLPRRLAHRRFWSGLRSRSAFRVGRTALRRRLFVEPLEDRTLLAASISGVVFNDLGGNGILDLGEPGLAGVMVYLDQDGSGGFNASEPSALTNGSGEYAFTGLTAGTYSVGVVPPDGSTVTFPETGTTQIVQLDVDQTLAGVQFGLQADPGMFPNDEVTTDPGVQQMPSVAVNPLDSNHVVMAYMDYSLLNSGYAGIGISVSHDGGTTWQQSSIPLPAGYDEAAGQPIAQFDAQGKVHVSFMAATFLGQDSDGSDLKPGEIYDTSSQTLNYLGKTVSRRAFGMQANNGVFVAASSDDGLTWETPVAVSAQRYDLTQTTSPTGVAAGSATVTPTVMPADLFVNKALIIDEGLPSMERVLVTDFTDTTFTATFANAHAAGFTISTPVVFDAQPDLAIDTYATVPDGSPNPNFGNLYVTWTRFYPASQFPGRTTSTSGTQIMFSVSTDGGQTWTTRLQPGTDFSAVKDLLTGTAGATTTEGAGSNTLPRVTVGPEGGVYVSQFAGNRFPVFYSSDAGATFRAADAGFPNPGAAPFDRYTGYPFGLDDDRYTAVYAPGGSSASFIPGPTLATNSFRTQAVRDIVADPSRPGYVYAVESVQILDPAVTIRIDPGEITFARSTDYGLTWTTLFTVGGSAGNLDELPAELRFRFRSVLNDDDGGRFVGFETNFQNEVIAGQALPQMSVDAQGNIVVIWYDTRRDPANHLVDVYATVSTDGGQTFSANNRITSANFDANAGAFINARGVQDTYLGDRIGLAAADGKVYAAWTDTSNGNQDIFFSSYAVTPVPPAFNDRYESNDTPGTATDLGKITAQRVVPRLSLVPGDEDWFLVEAGATGDLIVTASAPAGSAGLILELYNADGTTLLATGSAVLQSGLVSGQQVSFAGTSGDKYLVRVRGASVSSYSLVLQSLTANLGTSVQGTVDGTISSGGQSVYRLVTAVGGSLELTLTSAVNVTGDLNLQVLSADGQSVLATGQPTGNPGAGEIEHISLAVDAGQIVLLQVAGTSGSSGDFRLDFTNLDAFETPQNDSLFFPAGGSSSAVAVQDVNGDNLPDLILTSTQGGDTVRVLLGNADGTFQSPREFAVGSGQVAISTREPVVADFTGDNIPDLVVPNYLSADVSLLVGLGDGTFGPQRRFDALFQANSVAAADFDNDGKLDLAVLDRTPGSSTVAILLNAGDGTFRPPQKIALPFVRGDASPVRAGDLNGDNTTDLVVFSGNDGQFLTLIGQGDGTFVLGDTFSSGEALLNAQLADLNGDNKLDVIIGGANSGSLFVLLGNGDGTFQDAQIYGTAPLRGTDNIVIVGLAIEDISRPGGGAADGRLDVVVTARYRSGSDVPQAFLLPGIDPTVSQGKVLGSAVSLGVLAEAGSVGVSDFNGDGSKDLAIGENGGVRILYGTPPTIAPNTTQATARNLGTVVHYLGQPQAIVTGFEDAYYKLTIPTDVVSGAGDQVLDFSARFDFVQGAGLQMEVLDANGNILGSGPRFRLQVAQGQQLFVHVFGLPAAGGLPQGVGVYTLDIAVLPQVVSVEAQAFLPGANGQPGGPVSSLVLTFQGDRLDPATAENPANYIVTWLGPDGQAGTADDQVIPVGSTFGTKPVLYSPGTNVDVSSGRTFPTAVRQTVTLLFADALPAGSYTIVLSPAIQAAPFNADEPGLLAAQASFTGHPVVSVVQGKVVEGTQLLAQGLVAPAGPLGSFDTLQNGTRFLTQFHADLGAQLDALLLQLGDSPDITQALLNQIADTFVPAVGETPPTSFAIFFFDPVSINLADSRGDRAVYDLQSNSVANNLARTFVEVGGNVEVMVLAGVSGSYTVNMSDIQPTARAGVVLISGDGVQTVSMTEGLRGGEASFVFDFTQSVLSATQAASNLINASVAATTVAAASLPTGGTNVASTLGGNSLLVSQQVSPGSTTANLGNGQADVSGSAGGLAASVVLATLIIGISAGGGNLGGQPLVSPDELILALEEVFRNWPGVATQLEESVTDIAQLLMETGRSVLTAPVPGWEAVGNSVQVPDLGIEEIFSETAGVLAETGKAVAKKFTAQVAALVLPRISRAGTPAESVPAASPPAEILPSAEQPGRDNKETPPPEDSELPPRQEGENEAALPRSESDAAIRLPWAPRSSKTPRGGLHPTESSASPTPLAVAAAFAAGLVLACPNASRRGPLHEERRYPSFLRW
jgi:SdrD B-like domain/FG-GAP-like repeat